MSKKQKITRRKRKARNNSSRKKRMTISGIVKKNRNGFGFLELPNQKIFISANGMNGAMDGDLVEIDLLPEYFWHKNIEAVVVKIKKRAVTEVVGTFRKSKKFGFVIPDNKNINEDIFVQKKNFAKATSGDKVVCQIVKYPFKGKSAEGKITEIIAGANDAKRDIKALIRQYGIVSGFEDEVRQEARCLQQKGIANSDFAERKDFRKKTVFTIDGPDSKDFDDAVSIEKTKDGNYLLGVHIADVSHYVKAGAPLDKEAFERGNSIYLIDTVIPMLPEELSNGICSLNPGEDRLTISCVMEIDKFGRVLTHELAESIICSKERLVYDDVSDILESDCKETESKHDEDPKNTAHIADLKERYSDILPDLRLMAELKNILSEKRQKRGSLDFDLDEGKIILNERGVAIDVKLEERRFANVMIEEFMLIANETVAKEYFEKTPFVYRVHDKPEADRMLELRTFLSGFGIHLPKGNVTPLMLNRILHDIKGKRYEQIVSGMILRTMQKAVYSEDCRGHFGLALKYYCHFTSPIRRYPDLVIHRIIKNIIANNREKKEFSSTYIKDLNKRVSEVASHSSDTERLATELERSVDGLKKAEYMSYHIDEEFDGIISGVTSYGFYVRLKNTVEGLVRIDKISNDYFDFDEKRYSLIGRRSGLRYTLGDYVRVKVSGVNIQRGETDFILSQVKGEYSN